MAPIECSTRERMRDFVRFFAWIAASMKCFHLHGRLVKSRARGALDHTTLALVCLVTVDPGLLSVQQLAHHLAVGRVRRRDHQRVDHLALAVDPDVHLHPEVPLVAFLV
jgi:hypothetical protein